MTTILTGKAARTQILQEALQVVKALKVTYGPYGRSCILDRKMGLLATRDGFTVAQEISLGGSGGQGASMLWEACEKMNSQVGDGTTTVAILIGALLQLGNKAIQAGKEPQQLSREIIEAASAIKEAILECSIPITTQEQMTQIGYLSSNGDSAIASALAEAAMAIGKDGTIAIEDGVGTGITLEFKSGMELDRGPLKETFLRGQLERQQQGPLVAVVDFDLSSFADIQNLLETASQWQPRELLLFARTLSGDALTTIALNDSKNVLNCVPIRCPGFGAGKREALQDIAVFTGATYISPEGGYKPQQWDPDWFGSAQHVLIKKQKLILTGYEEDHRTQAIEQHVTSLREQIKQSVSSFDTDRLKERCARLTEGLALIQVGGVAEFARKEHRARVEDALAALKAALRQGVCPGGGATYASIAQRVRQGNLTVGGGILCEALKEPLSILATNAGYVGNFIVQQLEDENSLGQEKPSLVWDAKTNLIRDMFSEPFLLDPTEILLCALDTAVSVANTIFQVEVSLHKKGV